MITFEVNGTPYTNFVRATVNSSLESLADDFEFTSSAVGGFPPIKLGDKVKAIIDGTPVLTGWVEEIEGQSSEGQHTVTYSGRDRTSDLIDSKLDQLDDIRASDSLTLGALIGKILTHIGSSVSVITEFVTPPFSAAEDIVSAKVGQSALELAQWYARKRQAILTSNADGNIVITRSNAVDSGMAIATGYGVTEESFSKSTSQRFRRYVHRAGLDPRGANIAALISAASLTDQGGSATDTAIRSGRQYVKTEERSYSSAELSDRAAWALQLALAQSTRYECTVSGHSGGAGVWRPNTLVQINSSIADITQRMLLVSCTYRQAEDEPTVTQLRFAEPGVYSIAEQLKPTGKAFDAFAAFR